MTRSSLLAATAAVALLAAGEARSAPARRPAAPTANQRLDQLQTRLEAQAAQLDGQAAALAEQRRLLEAQQAEIQALRRERLELEARMQPSPNAPPVQTAQAPQQRPVVQPANPNPIPALAGPVGQPPADSRVQIAALPEQQGVLTPKGRWYVEPSLTYTRSSANVLVFRGVEIVTGVQIGLLQANNAARDTLVGAFDVRYGLTNRLEVEARVPYVYRSDRITTVAQRDQTITRTQSLDGRDIGDVELSGRYQLNRPRAGRPFLVAGLRYKAATGTSPFAVPYDEFGAAMGLATGSGFHAIEPSISMLLPTDPAVMFASLSYIHSFGRDVNREIGGAHVGKVDPGGAIGASAGFGFAVNPRFSFSLGYKHSFIRPTYTELNNTRQRSNSLHVGAFLFGWSYALTPRISIASSMEIGATSDAPDLNVVFRIPIRF